tara:strand:+ start:701 stop:886 length:186 start_codon:yes stop_codon:yes gene_type:complete
MKASKKSTPHYDEDAQEGNGESQQYEKDYYEYEDWEDWYEDGFEENQRVKQRKRNKRNTDW